MSIIGIDASRANRLVRTGVEWYAFNLIQELKKVVPADVRVVLYSEEPLRGGLETLPSNWESRVLRWPPRRLWTQARLSWEMLRRPPDVLFVPAHVPPLIAPRNTVTTLHDAAFMVRPEAYRPAGRIYLRFMYRFAVRRGRILTVSEFSKAELVRLFSADPSRVAVTPLAFDAGLYRPPGGELEERLAANGIIRPYFLFVGRIEAKKNVGGLLRAFRLFRERPEGAEHRLVLVGKRGYGWQRELAALDDARIKDMVIELGYVKQGDMPSIYAGADALVFPSWYEGFGLPVLEAFACGTPAIVSRVASLPEVAGDAALYVDPQDHEGIAAAMASVAKDPALRGKLAAAGAARSRLFTWEKTARDTWTELRKLM